MGQHVFRILRSGHAVRLPVVSGAVTFIAALLKTFTLSIILLEKMNQSMALVDFYVQDDGTPPVVSYLSKFMDNLRSDQVGA